MRVENFMMPALRILDPNEGKLKYYYEGDVKNMTIADVKKFVGDFKTGNIRPWFASDEAPDTNTTDGLTVVVGKTWSDTSFKLFIFSFQSSLELIFSNVGTRSDW